MYHTHCFSQSRPQGLPDAKFMPPSIISNSIEQLMEISIALLMTRLHMYEGTNVYTLMRRYFTLSLSLSLSHTCKFYTQNMEKRGKRGIAEGSGTWERGTTHVSSFKFVIVMWYKPDTIVDLPSCSKHFIVAILKFNLFIMRDPELWLSLSLSFS